MVREICLGFLIRVSLFYLNIDNGTHGNQTLPLSGYKEYMFDVASMWLDFVSLCRYVYLCISFSKGVSVRFFLEEYGTLLCKLVVDLCPYSIDHLTLSREYQTSKTN